MGIALFLVLVLAVVFSGTVLAAEVLGLDFYSKNEIKPL